MRSPTKSKKLYKGIAVVNKTFWLLFHSFRPVLSRFISFCTISVQFISFYLYSFRLISSQFKLSWFISFHFISIVWFSFQVDLNLSHFISIHFVSFRFNHSIILSFISLFVPSFICSIRVQFIFISLLNLTPIIHPVKLDFVHWLLYTCCTLFLDLLCTCHTICTISRADRSDTHIDKMTPTARLREQLLRCNIHRTLFYKLTVILFCV